MKRTDPVVPHLFFHVLAFAAAFGLLSTAATGQLQRAAKAEILRRVVTGRVVMPDGSPAAGAVIVTNAGGQTVSGPDGTFALELELPRDADSLELTAIAEAGRAGGGLVANLSLVPSSFSPSISVGSLALALSQGCHPRWLPTFGFAPGANGAVWALTVFDDGGGPALFAGGEFDVVCGVEANEIAKWDGSSWSPLGSGMNGLVEALTVYDDGSGPALYAGGSFTLSGGVSANRIARWGGASWSALGSGMGGEVKALTVYDDGSGTALYAGGTFTTAGGVAANKIAKWNGASWSSVGGGTSYLYDEVHALTVYDDGSGAALYAGGRFSSVGGVAARNIARWNGSNWSALGNGTSSNVNALTVYDDGGGPALYAGGHFVGTGTVGANRVARWDGSSWSALGSGIEGSSGVEVHALTVHDDGSGAALFAGGEFATAGGVAANKIAKWNGASWSALGSGVSWGSVQSWGPVRSLAGYDDGSGGVLHVGGNFDIAGDAAANAIAKWDGSSWAATAGSGLHGSVVALAVYDDGGGEALYAGGGPRTVGGVEVSHVAKWDRTSWSSLGVGTDSLVLALTVYDDGAGPALCAGGEFTTAGGVAANRVARWDGNSWTAFGSGMNSRVSALVQYDDGGGPELYAGGLFTTAGGVAANRIAKWGGSSWSALGSGIEASSTSPQVRALAVYDDGSAPALFVGGAFQTAGGVPAKSVAKWDGASWSALGSGIGPAGGGVFPVETLVVHDDGSGPALYVAGSFTIAGGVAANNVARWDGSSWSALGSGLGNEETRVNALLAHDAGRGPELFAGGQFGRRLARWDGSAWTTIGLGINDFVQALAGWDDGEGPALYVGGNFAISPAGDSFLAKWGCRTKPTAKQRKL